MPGRPRTVSDAAVLEAVARVVNESGPAGLTFAAVGRATGLTASALAQRYGSKRGLLLAFARAGTGLVAAAFDRAERRAGGPLAVLAAALGRLVAGVRTRGALANNVALLHLDLVDPELRALAATQARELRRRVRGCVDAAVAAGELVATDTTALAEAVTTAYNGSLVTWAVDGRGSLARWVARDVERVLAPYRVATTSFH
jgi:AcrR family transcriptional regulator